MPGLAIVALTPRGAELGRRLAVALGDGELLEAGAGARRMLVDGFRAGRPLVCVMALGIAVRVLGPLTSNKATEPPVVVVDEAGRFAISVLGGHRAGANALAERVARALGAMPVITTASEALRLPAIDLIGEAWGWKLEEADGVTAAAAVVVRGEPVGVYQDAGRRDWWAAFGEWPAHFTRVSGWPPEGDWAALLAISDRVLAAVRPPTVVYRPPSLALGVGCRRGVPCAELEETFQAVCRTHGLAALALGVVATATLKADEPGLVEFAQRHNVPLQSYSAAELGQVGPLPTPSETVRTKVGVAGVAEPAAMLAAGTRTLLVPKQRSARVTMAVARREDV